MTTQAARVQTNELEFSYSARRKVVSGLSIAFGPGKTVLLGPNGSGKSTLLKLICGLLKPSQGAISVDGDVRKPSELLRTVGFMPQDVAPMPGLTVFEVIQYSAWLGGLSNSAARRASDEAIATVGLEDKRDDRSTRLSAGQLRRLGMAEALTRTGNVLLLDEPTAGLDPAQRHRFREVLAGLPPELTVVVSTHQMEDIEDIYDQVRVIAHGTLKWEGTPGGLLALAPRQTRQQAEQAYLSLVGEDN